MGDTVKKDAYRKPAIGTVEELSAKLLLANQELAQANEKLRLSEIKRSETLANISHDLRAPASALRSAVDTMRENQDLTPEERLTLLDIMDRRTKSLEHLITELHYLISLDLPGFNLSKAEVDLVAFAEEYSVVQEADSRFEARRIGCEVDPSVSVRAVADANALVRVLDNLYDNALRFTEEGDEITIGCKATEEGAALYVRDTGIGMEPDQLDLIFERTYKVSDARTPQKAGGSGLGLSIVRKIVELHGGRVWCESSPGAGSTFWIILPQGDA
ncbi:MAG: sensor histidine kinase [Oscillospiraceae bacterium]